MHAVIFKVCIAYQDLNKNKSDLISPNNLRLCPTIEHSNKLRTLFLPFFCFWASTKFKPNRKRKPKCGTQTNPNRTALFLWAPQKEIRGKMPRAL